MIVHCTQCGQKNNVEKFSLTKIAHCGKCGAEFKGPLHIQIGQVILKNKYWIILVIIGGYGVYSSIFPQVSKPYSQNSFSSSQKYSSTSSYQPIAPAYTPPSPRPKTPTFDHPIIPIQQGLVKDYSDSERIAPFKIRTPSGEHDYFVKLVDYTINKPVLTFFVKAGNTFDIDVPLGSYKLKYAAGANWYGEQYLFGPDTQYSEAQSILDFTQRGDEVSGHTVELIMQAHGNLHTSKIRPEKF